MRIPKSAQIGPHIRGATQVNNQGSWVVQCRYHYGRLRDDCALVQLTHDRKKPGSWQTPIPVCAPCRDYLAQHWRYWREEHRTDGSTSSLANINAVFRRGEPDNMSYDKVKVCSKCQQAIPAPRLPDSELAS